MAHIWMDAENVGAHVMPRTNRKIGLNDTASAKKSVLSKLDNVLYNNNNKPNITPFKGANNQLRPTNCAPKLTLFKETLQKQHRKQIVNRDAVHLVDGQLRGTSTSPLTAAAASNDLYAQSADPKNPFDLFDFMDFPSQNCLNNCHKSASQHQMEPLLSDDFIDKLLNHSLELEEEIVHHEDMYDLKDLDTVEQLKPLIYTESTAEDHIPDILVDTPSLPVEFDQDFDLF